MEQRLEKISNDALLSISFSSSLFHSFWPLNIRSRDSIMKPSILFSIRDNAVLVRLEKYSVGKAAFLSSGLASRRLQAARAWRYRWKWARTIITVSLETFDAITRRHYEYLTKQARLFRPSSFLLPLPGSCLPLIRARLCLNLRE